MQITLCSWGARLNVVLQQMVFVLEDAYIVCQTGCTMRLTRSLRQNKYGGCFGRLRLAQSKLLATRSQENTEDKHKTQNTYNLHEITMESYSIIFSW